MMRARSHRLRLRLFGGITVLIMVVIFLFSAQNGSDSQELSNGFLASMIGSVLKRFLPPLSQQGVDTDIRKYAHMAEYFSLGASMFLFISEKAFWRGLIRSGFLSMLACFLYACSDEIHQLFVPGRAGMFRDVLVDGVGFCAGILLSCIISFIVIQLRAENAR